MYRLVCFLCISCFVLPGCKIANTLAYKNNIKAYEPAAFGTPYAEIPFEWEDNWIVLKVKISDSKGQQTEQKFIFDSGALTLMFADAAKSNHIPIDTLKNGLEVPMSTALGEKKIKLIYLSALQYAVGKYSFYKQKTMSIERPEGIDAQYAGMIGTDVFSDFFTDIDLSRNIIRLYTYNGQMPAYTNSFNITTRASNNPYITDLDVNGIAMKYLVDFGYNGDVLMQLHKRDKYEAALNSSFCKYVPGAALFQDAAGTRLHDNYVYMTAAATMVQGSTTISNVACNTKAIINPGKETKGNIGAGFFRKNFDHVAFDWKHHKLLYTLRPQKANVAAVAGCGDVVFRQQNDTTIAILVRLNSKWYNEGLKPGAVVDKINDESPDRYFSAGETGRNVQSLEITDKGQRKKYQ